MAHLEIRHGRGVHLTDMAENGVRLDPGVILNPGGQPVGWAVAHPDLTPADTIRVDWACTRRGNGQPMPGNGAALRAAANADPAVAAAIAALDNPGQGLIGEFKRG